MNLRESADRLSEMKGFDFLLHARKFGMKLGLETMNRLASSLGNPEKRLKFIHIAGTNGKGSTAAFCSQALQEAGYRTGLFTSPHLISITERIQINGLSIPENKLALLIDEIAEITRTWDQTPTFFEILTACALRYFENEKVDWVVWETGMGGRLDSTNIVTPEVTILTQIDFDHQEFLGDTLFKIAFEKAGIIKEGVPAVCGVRDPEALQVIKEVALKANSPLFETNELQMIDLGIQKKRHHLKIEGIPFQLSLLGEHQIQNALTAFFALFAVIKAPIPAIQRGFSKTIWPGRFQIIRDIPAIILDGAHNESSMRTLIQTWKRVFGEVKPVVVFGVMEDKSYSIMCNLIESLAEKIILVKPQNPRSIEPSKMEAFFHQIPCKTEEGLGAIWPQILASSQPILITGSLFLVGEALKLHQPTSVSEITQLNELLKSR